MIAADVGDLVNILTVVCDVGEVVIIGVCELGILLSIKVGYNVVKV